MKRKVVSLILAASAITTILAGCGSSSTQSSVSSSSAAESAGTTATETAKTSASTASSTEISATGNADTRTFDELLKAGKKNGKDLTIYSTASTVISAAEAFKKEYDLPMDVECTQIGDTDMITQVAQEVSSNAPGADIIFIQDGARTMTDLVKPGYVTNWYNLEILNEVGPDNVEPLLPWEYCNKVFMYNSNNLKDTDVANIWYLTDPKNNGTFQMKNPTAEGVNMDFLTQLTSDDSAKSLADAYKDYYGKDINLDDDCPNAGYQFIKDMYDNGMVLGTSDTDIGAAIGDKSQKTKWSALITLNKYSKLTNQGCALGYAKTMKPFAGFFYPIYALQTANADNPELAEAFLCWMFTEQGWYGSEKEITLSDGSVYAGMSGRVGDYSGNTSIAADPNDMALSDWQKVLVDCDPEYCAENRADVEDFIATIQ